MAVRGEPSIKIHEWQWNQLYITSESYDLNGPESIKYYNFRSRYLTPDGDNDLLQFFLCGYYKEILFLDFLI
jgi:hypothetical protein